jgi:hypothetical protein
METVKTFSRIVTRVRPFPMPEAMPVTEVLTTTAAVCPGCRRETRLRTGDVATIYGSCKHFLAIQQAGGNLAILFETSL